MPSCAAASSRAASRGRDARARCAGCGRDKLVAFSCKKRGVCPSCGGRRMRETAAERVTRVVPEVPVRQWVLSLPWALRLPVARDSALLTKVARIFFEGAAPSLLCHTPRRARSLWSPSSPNPFSRR